MSLIDTSTLLTKAEQTSPDPISDDRLLVYAIRLWQENDHARAILKNTTIRLLMDMGLVEFTNPDDE